MCNGTLPISPDHIAQVISLYACFNDNTLGRLWTSSMPYLFPFIVEYRIKIDIHFSLIAAAVTYIMWRSVGDDKIKKMEGKKIDEEPSGKKRRGYLRVDCQSASKGLFLGLLCLVGGIIILIIFSALAAFVQIQKLSHSFNVPYDLDTLLSSITVTGSYIYGVFGMLASIFSISETRSMVVFAQCALLVIQVTMQGMIISETSRRVCTTRAQQAAKPGRQIITFLLFANITLWVLDTFMSHRDITQ